MSLREQHLADQNKVAKIMSLVIVASMLLVTLLAFTQQVRPDMIVRCVILVVTIVLSIVGGQVLRYSEAYRYLLSIATFVSYLAFLFTYRDTFVFAYIFPIIVMIMIFQDARLIKWGAVLAVISDLIFFITFQFRFVGQVSNQVVIAEISL